MLLFNLNDFKLKVPGAKIAFTFASFDFLNISAALARASLNNIAFREILLF